MPANSTMIGTLAAILTSLVHHLSPYPTSALTPALALKIAGRDRARLFSTLNNPLVPHHVARILC